MQHCGFDPPLKRIFPVEGIFPLELTWVLTPFPPKLLDESINQGLVCAHMRSITQTQKILTLICPRRVNASNKNTSSMHHPRRRNVTTSVVGLKNGHIRKNLTQNGEPQRYRRGTQQQQQNEWKKGYMHLGFIFSKTGVLLSVSAGCVMAVLLIAMLSLLPQTEHSPLSQCQPPCMCNLIPSFQVSFHFSFSQTASLLPKGVDSLGM